MVDGCGFCMILCAPLIESRMYFRRKQSQGRFYPQIVESHRTGDQVRQRVIATLGRLDELESSGQLDRLLRSGARFVRQAMVLDAARSGDAPAIAVRHIGPALLFERLWQETGCQDVIAGLARKRGHHFAVERAVFLTVLHRLMRGGSDLAADRWREDYRIAGSEHLGLHHLYRAMAWLGEALSAEQQDNATPFVPRCTKDLIEEQLFAHRRDLFSRLDLVFMDTTSLYFEGLGGQSIGQYGYSKDHRPDLRQMILAVLIDGDGRPVCSEMWPGNTADVTALVPVIDRLRKRFAIGRVCIVADRGMISTETIAALEARGLLYILGVRERTDKLVRDVVLNDAAPFVPLIVEKRGRDIEYSAKAVTLGGARYIVCINHQQAEKDAADRAAVLAALERQLKRGDKALVGNTGYRRFLKTVGDATLPSSATRPMKTPGSTVCSCCVPTPISTRWSRCFATSSSGPSNKSSGQPSICWPRGRSSTSLTRPSAGTCSAASSPSCSRPNWRPALLRSARRDHGPPSLAISMH
jgi:hypothetical protein